MKLLHDTLAYVMDKAEDNRQIGSFIDSTHDISVQAGVVQNSQIGYPKNRTITDSSILIFERINQFRMPAK